MLLVICSRCIGHQIEAGIGPLRGHQTVMEEATRWIDTPGKICASAGLVLYLDPQSDESRQTEQGKSGAECHVGESCFIKTRNVKANARCFALARSSAYHFTVPSLLFKGHDNTICPLP